MSMLAAPDTITGPLTAADLDRNTNPGRIYRLHRVTVAGRDTCSGACETRSGCDCCAIYCAPEGGQHADPVPSGIVSMRRHRQTRASVALAIALAVAGYIAHIAWPLLG